MGDVIEFPTNTTTIRSVKQLREIAFDVYWENLPKRMQTLAKRKSIKRSIHRAHPLQLIEILKLNESITIDDGRGEE